jgi:hypothetical protein
MHRLIGKLPIGYGPLCLYKNVCFEDVSIDITNDIGAHLLSFFLFEFAGFLFFPFLGTL